jgi:hypothetical protein
MLRASTPVDSFCEVVRIVGMVFSLSRKLQIDEIVEIVAGHGGVVVELAVLSLWAPPSFPAIGFIEG